jgi:membrane protease YdiL (CAAX protease family)
VALLMVGWTLGGKSEMTNQYSKHKRMNHPTLLVLLIAASMYVGKWWVHDVRAARAGKPNPQSLPGATRATWPAVVIAVSGAFVLLALETAGEIGLGVAHEQGRISWLFAFYSIASAPLIEELIFRGWLVVEDRGRALMWAAAIVASLAFALFHPFLWRWDDGLSLTVGVKGFFSTGIVFTLSLWLYAARLGPWNPERSLLPCIAAHAAKNLGVVAIKAATGYIDGWA